MYIVIQQYVDINNDFYILPFAIDKPHKNAVYVFVYCYSLRVATEGSRSV